MDAQTPQEDNRPMQPIMLGSAIYENIRRSAFEESLAINNGVAPTDIEMARIGHKTDLLKPRNPGQMIRQMYVSGFSPLMERVHGPMIRELEAPERMLTQFPNKQTERRMKFLEYRLHKSEMLCCDRLDTRNPLYQTMYDALIDQQAYQIARTNRDFGITEREYQATDFTNNTTNIDERQTLIEPQRKPGGILSKLKIF